MLLLLDNFDSFTYNLYDYLSRVGAQVRVLRNDQPLSALTAEAWSAVVLSPGHGRPQAAGNMPAFIAHYAKKGFPLPILGVCLGHQALGEYFGAKLQRATYPMHGKISRVFLEKQAQDSVLFRRLPAQFEVVRYHSLLLTDLPASLRPLAYTQKGELMAFEHCHFPIFGVQFHPEAALSEQGLEILRNFVTYTVEKK
nr:aminodeoxychorismate/anthranilate synthase component II [Hugenholtzia roseola]